MSLFDDPRDTACPLCGGVDPLEIVYGMPSGEMLDAAAQGLISLGGCVIDPNAPAFECRTGSCGHRFGML